MFVVLGVWYEFKNPTEYDYICTNCGSVRKSFIPPRSKRKNSCPVCSHSQLIPVDTTRGGELMEMYHGAASANGHFLSAHEAVKKLAERLEGGVPPSDVADELEKLVRLVQDGALAADEWQRAKAAILGKPKDKQAEAIERVAKLYRAHQSGVLSQSEFNMTKWDILSRVGQA
jgi:DNA-directed RNA polymerase subunit RPC12/RpoP